MRFVIAIVAFVVAALMIAGGIAQRTIWIPPSKVSASTAVKGGEPYIVIEGSALLAHDGQQTLTVSGSDKTFVAYGRTSDVLGWIGDSKYAEITYDAATNTMSSHVVDPAHQKKKASGATSTPQPTPVATPDPASSGSASSRSSSTTGTGQKVTDPRGSDLWLQEFSGSAAAVTRLNVPSSVSVIIASDGTKAAPDKIGLSWPLDDSTPWAGPLIVGGMVLALLGVVMYILGLRHMRRSRGPRRGGGNGRPPRLPRESRRRALKPQQPAPLTAVGGSTPTPTQGEAGTGTPDAAPLASHGSPSRPVTGRRRRGLIAVPVVLAGAIALTGCSSQYWPEFGSTTPTPTSTPIATDLPGQGSSAPAPAVTQQQLANIVASISQTAAKADSSLNTTLAATRFSGPALDARTGNYALRTKKSDAAAAQAIPTHVALSLPEATNTWPRVVTAVVSDPANSKTAPLDLVLTQQSARENYTVEYAIALEADANVPDLPPATIGTTIVPPDSKLLLVQPQNLASDYADVLSHGDKSPYYRLFDEKSDKLSPQVGEAYRANQIANMPKTATLQFSSQAASGSPVAMATNDSGAVVATAIDVVTTSKPVEAGATVSTNSANVQALTGVTDSTKGIEVVYGYQLLFYVPPAASGKKIVMLGFTQSLLSAKELS